MNKHIILVDRKRLLKNIYYILRSAANQMLFTTGKNRQCECNHPSAHILSPVHLHLSGDLSLSADDADSLRVDPDPVNVRLKHFRALRLLIEGQVQCDLCIHKRNYIKYWNSAYCNAFYLCSVS